jgi:hypothetical protein
MELGARYYQATGATQYANANYNADFTAFHVLHAAQRGFHQQPARGACERGFDGLPGTRGSPVSRIVDDLRQEQDDPYAASAIGDFDYTSRETIDWQNDVKIDQRGPQPDSSPSVRSSPTSRPTR